MSETRGIGIPLKRVQPIHRGTHDATKAYETLDIVVNASNTAAYMAVQDVPVGTALTDANYWEAIVNVSGVVDNVNSAVNANKEELQNNIDTNKKETDEAISQLSEEIGELIHVEPHPITKEELAEKADSVYDNGYYDVTGEFIETGGYVNYQIDAKANDYTIGFRPIEPGYVQMSVFSGAPGEETFVQRYRTSDGNLPTAGNPLSITTGQVVVIATVTHTPVAFTIVASCFTQTSLSDEFAELIAAVADERFDERTKKRYVRHVNAAGENASTERLEIYIPMKVGYLCYYFVRSVSTDDNHDVWRISSIHKASDALVIGDALTSNGEWECAIRLTGRSDFAGGFMHGDEMYESLTIFIDGEVVTNRANLSELTAFEKLEIVQYSYLYDPNDSVTIFATHGSKHIWADELTIEQSIDWWKDAQLEPSYLAMYPPLKTMTKKWYSEFDYKPRDIVLPQTIEGCRSVCLYDPDNGFLSKFSVSEYPNNNDNGYFLMADNGGNAYNKCYFAVCGYNGSAKEGDVWKSVTNYSFNITK